jgi:hypothetical protein
VKEFPVTAGFLPARIAIFAGIIAGFSKVPVDYKLINSTGGQPNGLKVIVITFHSRTP